MNMIARVPSYRAVSFPPAQTVCERRSDGSIVMRSARKPPKVKQSSFADWVPYWAERRAGSLALCERDANGEWRSLTWSALWSQVQAVAAALLEINLGRQRQLILLSGNSIEQAVLLLAAEYVGVPAAPVSPAYSLQAGDFVRLKGVRELLSPGTIFVQSAEPFARALAALDCADSTVVAVDGAKAGQLSWASILATDLTPNRRAAIKAAHAAIRGEDTVRILFTSGSTGTPKGVATSYHNFKALMVYQADAFGSLVEPQPVFLDWLPWHHALGGVLNLGRSILLGATHYIDDGRPAPGLFQRTVRNLREISPTIFNNVPSFWMMLADELEQDPLLAQSLFSKVVNFGYGGASLPSDILHRIQSVAEKTIGERIAFCSGLASTETTGLGTYCGWATEDTGNIGVPAVGTEVKLVPLEGGDGRYEIRVRGPSNFSGYLNRPDLTAAAFDDEGYFCLGDAVRLADPNDPANGLRFAGRVSEDFKLTNGTWVRTGAVRVALLEQCAPLLSDAVICGHDHDYLAALAWPNIAACRRLAPELSELDATELVRHPAVVAALRDRLSSKTSGTSSLRVRRLMLMAEPPSIDANEIADKGYVNQAATRARRAHLVEELYQPGTASHIAYAG
jgi:feruloyl-CoA synthase